MEPIDVLVIGAGVTGLATALSAAARGWSTCVLERHGRPGLDTSTHNSGVIHAGIYYPPGSLKARLCVEGRHLLYEFCEAHAVPHSRCGKLIVAIDPAQTFQLEALEARGRANGVDRLEIVDRGFVARHEPTVRCVSALYSPQTGVLDADALVKTLLRTAVDAGAVFLPASECVGAHPASGGIAVRTARETIVARQVVNAGGLYADEVSHLLGAEPFTIYPARGEYAELIAPKRALLNGLIYPLPDRQSLGVHVVKTVAGAVWFGPTVRFQEGKDDYERDRLPVEAFVAPIQRLLPTITVDDLRLAGSGIRARLHPPSESFADFLIRRDAVNPLVVQAAGIESPGLTSCLAVGRLVAAILAEAA